MKYKTLFSVFLLMVLVLSACAAATPAVSTPTSGVVPVTGLKTDTPTGATPVTILGGTPGSNVPEGPAIISVNQNATLGSILVDSKGMTLYIFTQDQPNVSNCYDGCAQYWPPLLTLGVPTSGTELQEKLLDTIKRKDGTTQVTYNGWPLYYYQGDKAPGDTTGEKVQGSWFAIGPDGTKK